MPGDGDGGRDGATVTADANSGPAYTEALCADPLPSLATAAAAYQNTPAGVRAASLAIAAARYPIGTAFINEQTDVHLMTWYRNRATFAGILDGFEVAVHEGQHIWDITMAQGMWPYRLRDDLAQNGGAAGGADPFEQRRGQEPSAGCGVVALPR